jgi:hypothetical protein
MTTFLLILFAALLLGMPAMANLTAVLIRPHRKTDTRVITVYPAAGALFAGALVEEDGSGNMQNATAAGTTFTGMALSSSTAANDRIEVMTQGEVRLSIAKGSAIALTDLGATVYVGDGGTDINLTSTSRQAIGKIVEVEAAAVGQNTGFCWVHIEGQGKRSI